MPGHFEDIEFTSQQIDHPLKARLYVPDRVTPRTGLTTLIHGWGGNRMGFEYLTRFLDAMELFSVNVEYRDSGLACDHPDREGKGWNVPYEFGKLQAIDTLRAVHAVLQLYPINRKRLFLIGGSGGGHNVLQAMAFAPNTFALTVALAPITRPTNRSDIEAGAYRMDPKPGAYADQYPEYKNAWGWEGAALGDDRYVPDEWDIRNCQRPEHVAAARCKVILVHGSNDATVDPRHSIDMAAALLAARKRVSLHLLDGVGHEYAHSEPTDALPLGGALERFAQDDLRSLETRGHTDYDRRGAVRLGRWQISYEEGVPELIAPSS